MPGQRNLDKGHKRRVRRIRWKRSEIVSAIVLTIVMMLLSIYLAWWLAKHPIDESGTRPPPHGDCDPRLKETST